MPQCIGDSISAAMDYYDGVDASSSQNEGSDSFTARSQLTPDNAKLIIAMVGMPCCGKSSIARRLVQFLSWKGLRVKIFNAGKTRRQKDAGKSQDHSSSNSLFDTRDADGQALKEQIAMDTLDALLEWLHCTGEVAFFDATNSTAKRRRAIINRVAAYGAEHNKTQYGIVFLESLCNDPVILEASLLNKVRTSPDFAGMNEEEALTDLKRRIAEYESVYEPLQQTEGSWIKVMNMCSYVVANRVYGRLTRTVLPFVCSMHTSERPIFLIALVPRRIEKEFLRREESRGMIKTDSDSSLENELDADLAKRLAAWVREKSVLKDKHFCLLASTQPTALEAAAAVAEVSRCTTAHQSVLNPLYRGPHPDLETEDESHLDFTERFGGGESYADLVHRLETSLLEIEASIEPVLVISHATPCRALRAYFLGLPVVKCMEAASSDGASCLADERPCVLELNPYRGRYEETVHFLEPAPQ
eukprot:CAMPEP_0170580984 /NCGR_PEP_ID=MMETSP0224-20130122/6799_1 /TAXON_ID=285029 /ORGANISM="Togula jolla, Strain CCCM 725" /LENGTH=472 /DNA_ID=CAMNT_0010904093 /DNA_START=1 /DNA_END=1419 /DNA_ORIENTATION=+